LRRVGGIDFGFRNPFGAVWGVLDRDGVLWLTGEYYARQRPLSYHAERLPRGYTWYADPSGANEIAELRMANFSVLPGVHVRSATRARSERRGPWLLFANFVFTTPSPGLSIVVS
jgi:hypothetical protein